MRTLGELRAALARRWGPPPTLAWTPRRRTAGRRTLPPGARAVVMTMGALHDGHLQLVRAARERVGPTGRSSSRSS
ncbi:pantoate--beta-alanine ligase [Oerskovia sp. M15]